MVFVILVGIGLLFIITTTWYVGLTLITALLYGFFSLLGTEGANVATLTNLLAVIWGPIFDGIVILWMIASASARDVESDIYR